MEANPLKMREKAEIWRTYRGRIEKPKSKIGNQKFCPPGGGGEMGDLKCNVLQYTYWHQWASRETQFTKKP
jgi:hypothetical protein